MSNLQKRHSSPPKSWVGFDYGPKFDEKPEKAKSGLEFLPTSQLCAFTSVINRRKIQRFNPKQKEFLHLNEALPSLRGEELDINIRVIGFQIKSFCFFIAKELKAGNRVINMYLLTFLMLIKQSKKRFHLLK